jgi:hypothetical protein
MYSADRPGKAQNYVSEKQSLISASGEPRLSTSSASATHFFLRICTRNLSGFCSKKRLWSQRRPVRQNEGDWRLGVFTQDSRTT